MSIALKLREFRKKSGLSQHGLADASGVSQQLISQIENGKHQSTKHLAALARVLGKNLTDFDPSLSDVLPEGDFYARYAALDPEGQLVVQAVIERLERSREESNPSNAEPTPDQLPEED